MAVTKAFRATVPTKVNRVSPAREHALVDRIGRVHERMTKAQEEYAMLREEIIRLGYGLHEGAAYGVLVKKQSGSRIDAKKALAFLSPRQKASCIVPYSTACLFINKKARRSSKSKRRQH